MKRWKLYEKSEFSKKIPKNWCRRRAILIENVQRNALVRSSFTLFVREILLFATTLLLHIRIFSDAKAMLATRFHKNVRLKSFQRELRTFLTWNDIITPEAQYSQRNPSWTEVSWVRRAHTVGWDILLFSGGKFAQLYDVGQWSLLHVRRASWLMIIIDHNYSLAKFSCRRTFMI